MEKLRPSIKDTVKNHVGEVALAATIMGAGGVIAGGIDTTMTFVDATSRLNTSGYISNNGYEEYINRLKRDIAVDVVFGTLLIGGAIIESKAPEKKKK